MMKVIPSEFDEQKVFLQWLRLKYPKVLKVTHHSPNEGKRSWFIGKLLKALGLSPGYPDLAIHVPNRSYHGLFIEMKRSDQKKKAKKLHQENWLKNLNENGYLAVYCYSAEEAIKLLENYISNC